MGKKDYETLLKIKQFASGYCKLMGIPITFHIDRDENDFETAIIFDWEHPANSRRPHETEDWGAVKYPKHMVCPDLVCFELGLIIEFEEEHGNKKTGARLATKGHANKGDIDTPRDCNRNMLYSAAGYQLVRIYKSDFTKDPLCWKSELADAINDRWTMRKLRTTTAEVLAKIVDIDKQ